MAAEPRELGTSSPGRTSDRVPPHNLDAEVSVLGSMLLSKDAIADVNEILHAEDFYRGAHRTVYEIVCDLYDRGEPVDTVVLGDELDRRGLLESVGGVVALSELIGRVPTAANASYYARIVAEQALRRRLIETGTKIAQLGYAGEHGADETVDQAEALMYAVAQRDRHAEFTSMKDLLAESFEIIERLHENDSAITGLATGFYDLDDLTAGLQPQNLIILAARPGMGKSTLVTNLATSVAVEQRQPAVIFSLEMSKMELVQRVLASEGRVDSERLRTGRLNEQDWPKLSQAMGRLAEAPLFIDDTPGINMMELRSKCRRLKQLHGLDLVIVDYLQLMSAHRRVESRVQEVSELSRGLKILAKELDVPVIGLSQLSRKPEDRHDRRPQLSDLRESGCLVGATEVTLASGRTARIDALVGEQPQVMTLEGWRSGTARASKVWRTGHQPVLRLSTTAGRSIVATGNHPFLGREGWRPLASLTTGDHIAAPAGSGDHEPEPGEALHLGDAPESDVFWDRVASVEPAGSADVYDMTVPGTHSFVANGVHVHNSIEQDADLVAFIYRDEVYDPESVAKGEAELIVAKNRHGPLRTVRLSFIGHQSRFANMARGSSGGAGRDQL